MPFCDGSHKAYNEANGTSIAPKPVKNETDADKDFYLCMCGHSKNRPFCDGSHKGSEFSPMKVEITVTGTVFLCGCKHSGNRPYCDGTHRTLDDD